MNMSLTDLVAVNRAPIQNMPVLPTRVPVQAQTYATTRAVPVLPVNLFDIKGCYSSFCLGVSTLQNNIDIGLGFGPLSGSVHFIWVTYD